MTAELNSHHLALPNGARLFEFEILRTLGHGGFGITYLAVDTNLQEEVAIKEYFPNDMAFRESTATVLPKSGDETEDFEMGLKAFLEEARMLARFRHPRIVHVRRFFEQHGTGYIVFDFVPGKSLSQVIAEGSLSENRFRRIFDGILEGLEFIHEQAILHRDLKPSNIMLNEDDNPVIIDFGSARDFASKHSRTITAVTSSGYSPPEQYGVGGENGPWTDLYALGAIAYRYVAGAPPPESLRRLRNDPYVPAAKAAKGNFTPSFLAAIDWMLRIDETERPASVAEVRRALSGEVSPSSAEDAISRQSVMALSAGDQAQLQFNTPVETSTLQLSVFAMPPGRYVAAKFGKFDWADTPFYFLIPKNPTDPTGTVFTLGRDICRILPPQSAVTIASADQSIVATLTWNPTPTSKPKRLPLWVTGLAAAAIGVLVLGGGYYLWSSGYLSAKIAAWSGSTGISNDNQVAAANSGAAQTARPDQAGAAATPVPAAIALSDPTETMSVRDVVQHVQDANALCAVATKRMSAGKFQDALVLFEEAADRGCAQALTALAKMYDPNGFVAGRPFRVPEPDRSARYYKLAVEKGDTGATAPRAALRSFLENEVRNGSRSAPNTLRDYWP